MEAKWDPLKALVRNSMVSKAVEALRADTARRPGMCAYGDMGAAVSSIRRITQLEEKKG